MALSNIYIFQGFFAPNKQIKYTQISKDQSQKLLNKNHEQFIKHSNTQK